VTAFSPGRGESSSGPDPASPDRRGLIHQALLYDSADQFLASAIPFLSDGIRNGDAVVAVTSDHHTELLHEHLDGSDRVSYIPVSSWFDAPGRTLAAYYRHIDRLADKHECLRVLGEQRWSGLDPTETNEWGRYEAVVNVALASAPVRIMCGYDSRALPTAIVEDARRTHPELAVGTASQPSSGYTDPAAYYAERSSTLEPSPEQGVEWLPFGGDPAPVRDFIEEHAVALGLPTHRYDDFLLAVNEIATNAIRHGGGGGEVRLWRFGTRLVCEISDTGTADDNFLGFVRSDPNAERGHGLWIARQLCDLMEIRTRGPGTRIRLHMRV
jgi:anti-sigma regulatory factor (Ser/Thr protein kinase)